MKKNILIVEHSDSHRKMLIAMAEAFGCKHTHCSDGKNALTFLEKQHASIDLIVMNIALPVIDGISTLGHCKAHYPQLPVIILYAEEDRQDVGQAMKIGADDLLLRPFGSEKLKASIQKVMAS